MKPVAKSMTLSLITNTNQLRSAVAKSMHPPPRKHIPQPCRSPTIIQVTSHPYNTSTTISKSAIINSSNQQQTDQVKSTSINLSMSTQPRQNEQKHTDKIKGKPPNDHSTKASPQANFITIR
jgi:hypothetical protein